MARGQLVGKVVGIEKVVDQIDLYKETIRFRVRDEVGMLAVELLGEAQARAPVDTGNLRGSLRWSGAATEKGIYAQVGTDEPVGRWQEFGWTPNPHRGTKAKRNPFTGRVTVQGWTKGGGKYRKGGSSEWTRNPKTVADWADYEQRFGARKVYANPFLWPALDSMRDTIRERLRAAIEEAPG